MLKCWNQSTTTRNYAVTYYKTLQEVSCMTELKKWQILKKVENYFVKLGVFNDRMFKRSKGDASVGWWGRGGGQQWGARGTARWGVGVIGGGVNCGVVFNL